MSLEFGLHNFLNKMLSVRLLILSILGHAVSLIHLFVLIISLWKMQNAVKRMRKELSKKT